MDAQRRPQIQLVEADSPNGPWTPVPNDAVTVRVQDLDLARLENPTLDEIVPIDHRTVWPGSNELLGFEREKLIRERFGAACRLCHVRARLAERGVDPDHVKDWATVMVLLSEGGASGGQARAPDQHEWSVTGASKREIGLALGLDDDGKVAEALNSFCRAEGIVLRPRDPNGRHQKIWYVALDTLRPGLRERFAKRM